MTDEKPLPGTYVEVVETYADGTVVTTTGIVYDWDGGDYGEHLIYIGEARLPVAWTAQQQRRPARTAPLSITITASRKAPE